MCLQIFRKTKCAKSLETKRRQRLARNKRKKEEKKLLRKGLVKLIEDMKEENKCLSNKVQVEITIKEKYFAMWRASEKEKDKIKNARLVLHGCSKGADSQETDILEISPSLLEGIDGVDEIGKGRFGTVCLKKFRSTPVAVKYFDLSSTAKVVEREAMHLRKCCHINLPMLYGINVKEKPFFIVSQYYGNESFKAFTLQDIICEDAGIKISGSEHWLYLINQLVDGLCYIHGKEILHNDVKNDNIIVHSSSGKFSLVLIDFGKACLIKEGKTKALSSAEKSRYYKEHYHIAPEVIEGQFPQSIKSDVYSAGVVTASLFKFSRYRPLKEVARHCLKPYLTRCTSNELLSLVSSLVV